MKQKRKEMKVGEKRQDKYRITQKVKYLKNRNSKRKTEKIERWESF